MLRSTIIFLFSSLWFTLLFFFLQSIFFGLPQDYEISFAEDHHIESLSHHAKNEREIHEKHSLQKTLSDSLKKSHHKKQTPEYKYYPENFHEEILGYLVLLEHFFQYNKVKSMLDHITVALHKNEFYVRGQMKDKTIKLFGVQKMSPGELLSVNMHEFAHYVDLYFLQKEVLQDISNYFYEISWDGVKVLKPQLTQTDFVSGYAMTNKYEDFAESFLYYVIHNNHFQQKAQKSHILQKKYDFFTQYIFRDKAFLGTGFSKEILPKGYYRDTTRIEYDLEKLLHFLKKGI